MQVVAGCLPFFSPPATTNASGTVSPPSSRSYPANIEASCLVGDRAAYVFFNPGSGQGAVEDELETIRGKLAPHMPVKVFLTDPKKGITEQCQHLVHTIQNNPNHGNRRPLVVAAGGDGTVSAVARALMNTGIPLGVLPRGTANAYATALGIPTSLEDACENIIAGETRKVDAAKCDQDQGGAMILLAGIGFEAEMVKSAAKGRLKKWLGRVAYVLGGCKETVAPTTFMCSLKVNGRTLLPEPVEAHAVTVAVVAPAGSISAQGTGEVIPDDGLLDITVQTCSNTLETLDAMVHLLGSALVNRPTQTDNILRFRARELEVQTMSKQSVVVDGELFPGGKSFKYSILPKSLEVITPPLAQSENRS